MATSEGIPSSIDIEFLELNDNPYNSILRRNSTLIYTKMIETEMAKHEKWRKRTSLIETPTILVNGYKLPKEYSIEDLAMLTSCNII